MFKQLKSGLMRLAGSYRAWAAFIGIGVTLAVYYGYDTKTANDIAQKVLIIIGTLIGADTLNSHKYGT